MLKVKSTFEENGFIPKLNTCEGEDISPKLIISGIPEKTESLAIICDDPDAPVGTFVHWIIWNIPVTGTVVEINEGIPKQEILPNGSMQGLNDFGKIGYNGPCPPRKHGIHHYYFKVYALDTKLDLKGKVKKRDLEKSIEGHIIAQGSIVGLYERK
ncbi:MAG: YbhB/YbcL family Raf kinase inhibitor-like protein [Fervidobacterium sp.]